MKKRPITKHVMNVGVAALAREVGLSEAAVSRKMKAGQTPDQIRRSAAQRKGIKPPNTKGPGRAAKPSEYDLVIQSHERGDALEEAKLRRAKALAEHQEIDNMLRRGELMPVAYVRLWASRFLTDGRDELLKGPSEMQDALAAETDPLKCNAIVRAWVERIMNKFEQTDQLWKGDLDNTRVA